MMNIVNIETGFAPSMSDDHVLIAVLTRDVVGQYAVYVGITNKWTTPGGKQMRANWTAASGRKLPYAKALAFFPNLQEKEYRA